jgi:hypothetical protein
MGMYDTIHTPLGCGQVKCFGRTLSDLSIGVKVDLYEPLSAEAHEALYGRLLAEHAALGLSGVELSMAVARDGRSDALVSGAKRSEQHYDVRMYDGGGFLHVRDGRITGWDDTFDPAVPCFDGYGLLVAVIGAVGSSRAVHAGLCESCVEAVAGS